MNRSVKWNYLSQSNQKLLELYENLRVEALSKMNSNRPPGYSILLFRGMFSWIETCLGSELPQTIPGQTKTISEDQFSETTLLPYSINKEITMLLTNMVLSYQKELRNSYA